MSKLEVFAFIFTLIVTIGVIVELYMNADAHKRRADDLGKATRDRFVTAFQPPYITCGLYGRERRQAIEQTNRETVAKIFERREKERAQKRIREIAYSNHLIGVHNWGYCEWCGPRYFYD